MPNRKFDRTRTTIRKNWFIISALIALITWAALSYVNKGLIYSLATNDITTILEFIKSFEAFSAVALVVLVILEVMLAPLPPLILYVISGLLFGWLWGGLLVLLGNLIGALIDFQIARILGQKRIEKRIDPKIHKIFNKFFDKYGWFAIFILRINPLTTSDLVSYLAGFTRMKTLTFIISTGLGLIPLIFIQTYFASIFQNNSIFITISFIFGLIYLVLFIYLVIISFFHKEKQI